MASLYLLTSIYILGGITFVPLLLGLFLCHAYLTLPVRQLASETDRDDPFFQHEMREGPTHASSGPTYPPDGPARRRIPDVAAGYFAVCREYVPGGTNGKPLERTTPAGEVVAVESPSVYQTMYRSIFDRNKSASPSMDVASGRGKKGRNVFYIVLRLGHLMLYDNSEQLEVRHVISLSNYNVDIYAGGAPIPEGELWIKKNCIRLTQHSKRDELQPESKPFYIFSENSSEKEDFYHAMLQNQEGPPISFRNQPLPLALRIPDLVSLVQQLHASEDNSHTRWINALIGRLFLALYQTAQVEDFIHAKITKKIARVPKPAFITSINVQRIDMGNLPPFITNPRLKELTMEGDLTIEADVSYRGNFRLDISAIARVELGTRFKAREVTLVLASILKKLDGHILIRVKPPPSNRLWVTFETPPKMELSLEPIVSTRQITYGVILRAIESRIREVVTETLVFPNWDDIPFSDTILQEFRGGIWESNTRTNRKSEIVHTSTTDDSFPEISEPPDHSGLDAAISLNDATESVPNVKRTETLSLRKTTRATPELDDEAVGASSATDLRSLGMPKAMRSGSFSRAAIPIVDVNSANASALDMEESERQHDAVATIKTTMNKSPPASPSRTHVGSPPQLSSTSQRNTPSRTRTTLNEQSRRDVEISTSSAASQSANLVGQDTSSEIKGAKPEQITSRLDPPGLQIQPPPVGRRPTLNESLNTATMAARKWLTTRQNTGASASSGDEGSAPNTPFGGKHPTKFSKDESDVPGSADQSGETHPIGPVGRGQPLPPPGTPLPMPPKPEKLNNWATSTLANFTRRKNTLVKQVAPLYSDEPAGYPRSSSISLENASTLGSEGSIVEKQVFPSSPSNIGSMSGTTQTTIPSPLPKRRQRLSVTGVSTTHSSSETMLVVEAPSQEANSPTSPVTFEECNEGSITDRDSIPDKGAAFQESLRTEIT